MVTDEEIRERVEMDASGVLRWRAVGTDGLGPWALRSAQRINARAGREVPVGKSGCFRLYGELVAIGRVRAVLMGQAYAPKGKQSRLPVGVTINRGRYVARIKRDGRLQWVGSYDTPEQAAAARAEHLEGRS